MSGHTPGPWIAKRVGWMSHTSREGIYEVNNGFHRIAEYLTESDALIISAALDMRDALALLKTELGKLANELHNAKGTYSAGEVKSIAAEITRIFDAGEKALAKAGVR